MLRCAFSRLPQPRSLALTQAATTTTITTTHALPPFIQRHSIVTRPISTSATLQASSSSRSSGKKHKDDDGDDQPSSLSELIAHYGGWYPLVGLGTLAVISKELLVLNEEFLMVSNFAAFIFISWLAAGDTITQMVKEEADARRKHNDEVSDLYIDSIQILIRAYENHLHQLPMYQSLKKEYRTLTEMVSTAKVQKAKQAARDAAVAKLESLYQRERDAAKLERQKVFHDAVQSVVQSLHNMSQEEKSQLIDDAIKILEGDENALKKDIVAQLYRQYFQGQSSETEGEDTEGHRAEAQA